MAHIKKSEIRYRVIDNCLHLGAVQRQERGYSTVTTKFIFDKVNEKLRNEKYSEVKSYNTIRNDMLSMELANPAIEIVRDDDMRYGGYGYADSKVSFYSIPLREEELTMLTQTVNLLSRFEGLPQTEWLSELSMRLKLTLDINTDFNKVVGFDQNIYVKGLEYFKILLHAITHKEVVELTYRSFRHKNETTVTIHPYYLKKYNNRWFLLAKENTREGITIYALDRMIQVGICKNRKIDFYEHDLDFNDDYFSEIVGVSKPTGSTVEEVRLWFSNKIVPYIQTKPIHGSQRLKIQPDGSAIVILNIIINYEIEQLILSYCDDVKVIYPVHLSDRISKRLKRAICHYTLDK